MPVLIVSTETSGIDRYSQELSKRLDVKRIYSRRYLSLAESYRLARLVSSQEDIVHLTNQHFARYAFSARNPFIVTVHDVIRFCFGFDRETAAEKSLLELDIASLKKASRIIAVSQNTKNDLVKHLRIPDDKISVIYNGIDHYVFRPCPARIVEQPYILYVGSERPRKNLIRLTEAFTRLKKEFSELKLVKVGDPGRSRQYRSEILENITRLGISDDVIFTDYTSEQELARYYSSALLLAYPSLYEGFGFPPLEAMACGCPVVAANTSSLPEVIGDAGILVDPYSVDDMTRAMREVITNESLREQLVRQGINQSRKFNWEKAAVQTQGMYNLVGTMIRNKYSYRAVKSAVGR